MEKDEKKSTFDADFDPETSEEFLRNIETALGKEEPEKGEADSVNSDKEEISETEEISIIEEVAKTDTEDKADTEDNADTEDKASLSNEEEMANSTSEESESASDENKITNSVEDDLFDISDILAKQISEELGLTSEEVLDSFNDEETNASIDKELKKGNKFFAWFKSLPLISKITTCTVGVLVFVVLLGVLLVFTGLGTKMLSWAWEGSTKQFDKNVDPTLDEIRDDEKTDNENLVEVAEEDIVWAHTSDGNARHEDYTINILLLGEEAIGAYESRGRTDMIVIATMNTKEKSLKLTSLMRDTLVQIPGYKDNKLNSAYERGGIDLLYDVIEKNFDIQLDGCVLVDFDGFEKVIDELGGIEITLTESEARYLRNTNYISKPEYRTVQAGTQILNGNQALGYSRVRYRATATGQNNDYGRTERHRIVLNAIFDKCRNKSKVELVGLMTKMLPMITTDITSSQFEKLINIFFEIGFTGEIEQLRIPANGTFTDNVKVREMDVLIPDLNANIDILHTFIFGNTRTALDGQNTNAQTGDTQTNNVQSVSPTETVVPGTN